MAKKDIIEVKHHYEAATNLTKKRITFINDVKPYMMCTQSTVPEEICDIVGWNGYQGYLESPFLNLDGNSNAFVLP